MSIKKSKISYCSFNLSKWDEESAVKKIDLERGLQEIFSWRGGLIFKEGLDKKGMEKK